ncbi:MAG: VWA domain-containing protein, partial [Planctomycetota bacterium]
MAGSILVNLYRLRRFQRLHGFKHFMKATLFHCIASMRQVTVPALGRRERLGLLFCLSCVGLMVCASIFFGLLLSRPKKTSIITLTGIYGPQWDVNPWVEEDLASIRALSQGPYTIHELPDLNRMMAGFWEQSDQTMRRALEASPDGQPVLVYVNLHGAVDDQGRPCLIPPEATANDSTTWFPIATLIDHLMLAQDTAAGHPIILLLESGRCQSNWAAGIIDNEFDDHLEKLIDRHQQQHPSSSLTILSAASRGERGLASRLGNGSVFTRFVSQGLAGSADGGGHNTNCDGFVDTNELHHYVLDQVGNWARHHRATTQTPRLHPSGTHHALRIARVGRRQRSTITDNTPAPQKSELARLALATEKLTNLRDRDAARVNMHAWHRAQSTLHAIRQSTFGGVAARQSVDRWYSRLARQTQDLNQEIASTEGESETWMDRRMDRAAALIWTAVAKQPSRGAAQGAMGQVDDGQPHPTPLLVALLERADLSLWRHPEWIKNLASARARWIHGSMKIPDELALSCQTLTNPVLDSGRRLGDLLLADETHSAAQDSAINGSNPIEDAIKAHDSLVQKQAERIEALTNAWYVSRRVLLD